MFWLPTFLLVQAHAVLATNEAAVPPTPFSVTSLTVEYLEAPLGVDKMNPRLSWLISLSDTSTPRRGIFQSAYHIEVSDSADFHGNVWDCGEIPSADSSLVPLSEECEGLKLVSDSDYFWRVTVTLDDGSTSTGFSNFRTGLLSEDEWNAKWITGGDINTLLRSEFEAPPIQSHATLFVAGIGYHEVYLNGAKVGDHKLDPGWTNYAKRVWYSTYNVSDLLVKGTNAVGVTLGNGWWSCGVAPGSGNTQCENSPPQLLLQLHVDGQPIRVSTADLGVWQSAAGPITYNSLYHGEIFDARIAETLDGWTSPEFETSDWAQVVAASSAANNGILSSQLFEPIRHISTRAPIGVTMPALGVQVFDFGQNQAAVVRLKHIFCDRGAKITLRHAEILTHPPYGPSDGNIYVGNLREARATDVYICRGDAEGESYIPTFTQHGFRYVEVSGLGYPLDAEDIEAVELRSDLRRTSSVIFSQPLLNEIQHIVLWSLKSNLMSVPTDCPQRDERRGWMGDASVSAEAFGYNFGMGAFFTHWLMQIVDAQNSDGSVPDTVPPMGSSPGAPNWQSAFPEIIWVLHTYYGDRDVVLRNHDALVQYYKYFEGSYNRTGMKNFIQGFGDWVPPPPNPKADGHLTGAFAFLHDLQLGIDLFTSSSHPDAPGQARHCAELKSRLSAEYFKTFYNITTGVFMSGLQSEQALSIFIDAVPSTILPKMMTQLVKDIQVTNAGHTTCGIIGIKFLLEVLSIHGYSDVALDLALLRSYPSWGHMIHNDDEPATTVWELWNSDSGSPGMNSRNHHMYGSVSGWFYKHLAGVTPARPGYLEASIKPTAVGHSNLTHASALVTTPYGDIYSGWKLENLDGSFVLALIVYLPPGTNATLTVPLRLGHHGQTFISDGLVITENGVEVWANGAFIPGVSGITNGETDGDTVKFSLSNGRYVFTASSKNAALVLSEHEIRDEKHLRVSN